MTCGEVISTDGGCDFRGWLYATQGKSEMLLDRGVGSDAHFLPVLGQTCTNPEGYVSEDARVGFSSCVEIETPGLRVDGVSGLSGGDLY